MSALKILLRICIMIAVRAETDSTEPEPVVLSKQSTCILPPYPAHGQYITDLPESEPGQALREVTILVACDDGYNLVGDGFVQCSAGIWTGQMPECIAYCNTVKTNVVTCGEEVKCVLNATMVIDRTGTHDIFLEDNCGEVQPAIVIAIGGRTVEQTEAPWHSGIYLKTSTPYRQICGGSLVRKDVVISAAHCFWSDVSAVQSADQYAVAVGKIYRPWNNPRDDNAQKSDVKEIKIPPRFHGSATNFQDDLALLFLSSPFTYSPHVSPVCLSFDYDMDKKQLSEGNVGKVCGWGLTSANGVASQTLQVVDMPVVSVEQCIRDTPYEFKSHITSDKICAGNVNVTAVCRGDSGGGLVVSSDGSTRYHLRGVVSTAPNDGNLCNDHSWATFTHLLRHEHFIREHLGFFKNK